MSDKALQLQSVWFPEGDEWNAGNEKVSEIVMRTDGNGPMGFYDMIYVFFTDGPCQSFPAHMCSGWWEKEQQK